MSKPVKPILVVKVPNYYTLHMVAECKKVLHEMEGLKDDYYIIVATTDKEEFVFEMSCEDDKMEVCFKEFKKFKTIIENEKNVRTNGKSSEPEQ